MGEWRQDLEALRRITERTLQEMRSANGTHDGAGIEPVRDHTTASTVASSGELGGAVSTVDMAISGGAGWFKKVVGASSLLVLGAAWAAGSRLK